MQFKKAQRAELARTWNSNSWFYVNLGEPARQIVEVAYGLRPASAALRDRGQGDVSLALSLFSAKVGCDKAQACHALLSGSVRHLVTAMAKNRAIGKAGLPERLVAPWQDAFRDANMGVIDGEAISAALREEGTEG